MAQDQPSREGNLLEALMVAGQTKKVKWHDLEFFFRIRNLMTRVFLIPPQKDGSIQAGKEMGNHRSSKIRQVDSAEFWNQLPLQKKGVYFGGGDKFIALFCAELGHGGKAAPMKGLRISLLYENNTPRNGWINFDADKFRTILAERFPDVVVVSVHINGKKIKQPGNRCRGQDIVQTIQLARPIHHITVPADHAWMTLIVGLKKRKPFWIPFDQNRREFLFLK